MPAEPPTQVSCCTTTAEAEMAAATTIQSATLVEDATAFWEAVATGDRETAVGLIAPTGLEIPPFGRAGTLEGQFDWYEAVGWRWTLEQCREIAPLAVECVASAGNDWSDVLGVEPITGTFVVRFSGDGIVSVADEYDSFIRQWSPMVFEVFADWVATNHPADAEVMFDFQVDVNSEILELYEVNTERFVAEHGG